MISQSVGCIVLFGIIFFFEEIKAKMHKSGTKITKQAVRFMEAFEHL